MRLKKTFAFGLSIFLPALLVACSHNTDRLTALEGLSMSELKAVKGAPDPSLFLQDALTEEITTENCTLSTGVQTRCYKITIAGAPVNAEIGPFCPRKITDTAETVGIWFDGSGEVHDLDGNFIQSLPELYNDEQWQLYDPATGLVRVTDTEAACRGAARPNVDAQYQNHCVECSLDYLGGSVSQTFLIPVNPVPLDKPAALSGDAGVALNGVALALAAPVDAILGAHTIAAFDDCGGHINPHEGYHYHAATGCTDTVSQGDNHAPLIAYARDSYGIYAMADAEGNEHTDLDQCRGTSDELRGYHYHAASAAENMFIGCLHGDTVKAAHGPGGRPPPQGGEDGKRPPPPPWLKKIVE